METGGPPPLAGGLAIGGPLGVQQAHILTTEQGGGHLPAALPVHCRPGDNGYPEWEMFRSIWLCAHRRFDIMLLSKGGSLYKEGGADEDRCV